LRVDVTSDVTSSSRRIGSCCSASAAAFHPTCAGVYVLSGGVTTVCAPSAVSDLTTAAIAADLMQ